MGCSKAGTDTSDAGFLRRKESAGDEQKWELSFLTVLFGLTEINP
jgi:hypothetical protein